MTIPEHSSLGLHWGIPCESFTHCNKYSWAFKLRTSLRRVRALTKPTAACYSWAFKLRTSLRSCTMIDVMWNYAIPEHSSLGLHWGGQYDCQGRGTARIPEHSSLGLHWGTWQAQPPISILIIPEHSSLGLHWGVDPAWAPGNGLNSWAFKLRTSLRNPLTIILLSYLRNSWAFKLRTSLRRAWTKLKSRLPCDSWAFKLRTSLRIGQIGLHG